MSAIVYFTGGIDSYFRSVFAVDHHGEHLLYRKGALISGQSLLHDADSRVLPHTAWISPFDRFLHADGAPERTSILIGTNIFAFYAWPTGAATSPKVLSAPAPKLEDKRRELATLQAFKRKHHQQHARALFYDQPGRLHHPVQSSRPVRFWIPPLKEFFGSHVTEDFRRWSWERRYGISRRPATVSSFEKTIKNVA